MTVSKKQQASVNKYIATHYDRINVSFPKGTKDKIAAALKGVGDHSLESVFPVQSGKICHGVFGLSF